MKAAHGLGSHNDHSGRVFAATAAVLFGTAYIGTAFAIRSFTPMGAAMWRGVLASAVLVPLLAWAGRRGPASVRPWTLGRLWRLVVLGLAGGLGFAVGMNTAVSMAGATIAAFAASLSPVLAAVLARLVLGEALTPASVGGFAIAAVGTGLLSVADPTDLGPGVFAGLFAALSFALFLVLSRRWSRSYDLSGSAIALSIAATTGLGLLALEAVLEPGQLLPREIRLDAALGLLWLALVPGVVAQLFVVASVRRVETQASAAMLLVSPITTAILAALLLGETLTAQEAGGAALILAGVVGAAVLDGRSRRTPTVQSTGG